MNFPRMALSIRQPWAHHILHDGKDVENRNWHTDYLGWVLIHTGTAWADGKPDEPHLQALPRGGIVGAVRIVDCVSDSNSRWFYGKWGFVLRDPIALPFVRCHGRLSFFQPEMTDYDWSILKQAFTAGQRKGAGDG